MITEKVYPFPSITTDRLVMRQIRKDDVGSIYRALSNPRVTEPMLIDAKNDISFANTYVDVQMEGYAKKTGITWAISKKDTGDCIGAIGFSGVDEEALSAEIGYWTDESEWNKGYATEALCAMLRFGFEYMDLHRIYARCNIKNAQSVHVMKKANMQIEGISRDMVKFNGNYVDIAWFSIISTKK